MHRRTRLLDEWMLAKTLWSRRRLLRLRFSVDFFTTTRNLTDRERCVTRESLLPTRDLVRPLWPFRFFASNGAPSRALLQSLAARHPSFFALWYDHGYTRSAGKTQRGTEPGRKREELFAGTTMRVTRAVE